MKVIANIATTGKRPDSLKKTIDSLSPQVLHILTYDNSKEAVDYTDNAKFFSLDLMTEPVYYLTMDDDIIYPPDYVEKIIEAIEKYQCIVTFHGRVLNPDAKAYYKGHKVYDFRQEMVKSVIVDVGGSGVMGFSTEIFNPTDIYASEYKRMSDLVVSLRAKQDGIPIVCAAHPSHWLVQQSVEGGIMKESIGQSQESHMELVSKILNT